MMREESSIVGFFITILLCQISFTFFALRMGGSSYLVFLAAFISLTLSIIISGRSFSFRKTELSEISIIIVSLGIVFCLFWRGATLPAHDPIAVPVLAKGIADGFLPLTIFPVGSSAYTYPPGEPIILAPVVYLFGPLVAVSFLKVFTLIIVALIPASWALAHDRLFPSGLPKGWVLAAYYIAFFGVERTLLFAVPFAGKNALLLGIFLIPPVTIICLSLSARAVLWLLGSVLIFGLALINYSLFYGLAAFVCATGFALFFERRITFLQLSSLAIMGIGAAVLMFISLTEAISDPRVGSFDFDLISGLINLFKMLLARTASIVIYSDAQFGVFPFYYRGLLLVICFLLTLAGRGKLSVVGTVYFSSILLILCFSFNIIPVGISFDFGRWILFPFQASLIAVAIMVMGKAYKDGRHWSRLAGAISFFAVFLAALCMFLFDARTLYKVNNAQAISRAQLTELAELTDFSEGCHLLSVSRAIPQDLVTIQQSKLLDYAEIVTPCRFANGSWIHPGVLHGRENGGLPDKETLKKISTNGEVFFIGTFSEMEQYRSTVPQFRFSHVGSMDNMEIWKVSDQW